MHRRPGEGAVAYVKRTMIWDAVVEGDIEFAGVAHSVEQVFRKDQVVGSIPTVSSNGKEAKNEASN